MSDEKPKSSSLWLVLTLVAVILVPCLYVASIGPVVRWADAWRFSSSWIVVYAPVQWAHDHTFLQRPLELYVAVWTDLIPGRGD